MAIPPYHIREAPPQRSDATHELDRILKTDPTDALIQFDYKRLLALIDGRLMHKDNATGEVNVAKQHYAETLHAVEKLIPEKEVPALKIDDGIVSAEAAETVIRIYAEYLGVGDE